LIAQIEYATHLKQLTSPIGALEPHTVAELQPEVVEKIDSHHRSASGNIEIPIHEICGHVDDVRKATWIDPEHQDRLSSAAADSEHRPRGDGRCGGDSGVSVQRSHELLPAIDGSNALCRRLHPSQYPPVSRLHHRPSAFLGGQDAHVGLSPQGALDQAGLQP
jgi:hypothetical protein